MENNTAKTSFFSSFTNFLTSTTTSSVSSLTTTGYGFTLKKLERVKIDISCKLGSIVTNIDYTQFGITYTSRSPHEVNNVFETKCTNWGSFFNSIKHCEGLDLCSLEYRPNWLFKECQKDQIYDEYYGFIKVYCKDAEIQGKHIRQFYIKYFVTSVSLILIFQGFLIWLFLNEKYFMKQYKKKFRSPNEYSLQLRGFPSDWTETEVVTGIYK